VDWAAEPDLEDDWDPETDFDWEVDCDAWTEADATGEALWLGLKGRLSVPFRVT
jgi:hypothetical protein